ncbi:hypothetical protein [Nostoc sp.]|uniref:hypothetical protein n=1 Tax=Nostoc sp. TaxID=1180 RepID=UPI002FF58A71
MVLPTILLKRLGTLFFGCSQTTPAKIRLFEKSGETSQLINAELDEKGDLRIIGQDGGKAAMPTAVNYAHWGDEDYEF